MTITVNGPNGLTINFPDNTDTDTIHEVMSHASGLGAPAQPKVGMLETVGRAAADTGSFGLANGALGRERLNAGRDQNPWSAFAGDALGVIGQGAALASVPEVAGPAALARYANPVRAAARTALLPNLEANTLGQVARTSAKVGGAQGLAHGIGDTITNPDKTLADIPGQAFSEGVTGAATGAILGPVIHNGVRLTNWAYHKVLPGADQALADFRNPGGAATDSVMRAMDYDGVTPSQMAERVNVQPPRNSGLRPEEARDIADRLQAGEDPAAIHADYAQRSASVRPEHVADIGAQDQAIRAQYDNLNPLEAIKAGPVRQSTRLPAEVPVQAPVHIDPATGNPLYTMHGDVANLIADRLAQGESPAQVASRMRAIPVDPANPNAPLIDRSHVDAIAGQTDAVASRANRLAAANVLARQTVEMRPEVRTATNMERVARDAARQDGAGADEARAAFMERKDQLGQQVADRVETALGSQDRMGDQRALGSRLDAAKQAYNDATAREPMVNVPSFGGMETNPVFRRALEYAANAEQIRNGGAGRPAWRPSDGTASTEGQQYLTPRQLVDIHHDLVLNSKPQMGQDPSIALQARQLKEWFSGQADQLLAPHHELRTNFARIRGIMDATEQGASLPVTAGDRNHPSLQFYQQAQQRLRETDLDMRRETMRFNAAQARFQNGSIADRPSRADLNQAEARATNSREIVNEFRSSWGEAIAQAIYRAPNGNPSGVINQLLSAEGKARLMTVLGRDAGSNVISALHNVKLQTQLGNTLYGNSDTAYNIARMTKGNAAINAGGALLHGRFGEAGQHLVEMVSGEAQRQRNDATNQLMSRQGIDELRRIFDGFQANRQQTQRIDPFTRNPALTYGVPIASRRSTEDLQGAR